MKDEYITLWHPDSPGGRVKVPNNWWNRRKQFASLRQTIQSYKRVEEH